MKSRNSILNLESPTFELIENGQILLLTQKGEVDFEKAHAALEGILYFLYRTKHTLHLISDMTQAKVLPEAGQIVYADITKEELAHPMLGIQTMVVRNKRKDYTLEKIMKEHEAAISQKLTVPTNGEYKNHILYFNSVEDAKAFLLHYNDIWEIII